MPEPTITERFTALAKDVRGTARVAPVLGVRARGDHRRRAQFTGLTAIAAGVMTATAGVTVLAASGIQSHDPMRPGGEVTTTIPDDFVMPHQGEAGWTRVDDPRT